MHLFLRLISFCLASFLFTTGAYAADIQSITDDPSFDLYIVTGEIKYGDDEIFKRTVENSHVGNKVGIVLLNSYGGNVKASLEIAAHIESYNFNTAVLDNNSCYSACFLLFMAGNFRLATANSNMGVHRISDEQGENASTKELSIDLSELYRRLNVPPSIRLAMLETPASEMHILTAEEKRLISTGDSNTSSGYGVNRANTRPSVSSKCVTLNDCLKEIAENINSTDYQLKYESFKDGIIPQLISLTKGMYTDYQQKVLGDAIRAFVRQCEHTDAILSSAGISDNYSVYRVKSTLLQNLVLDLLLIDPDFIRHRQKHYSQNPPVFSRFKDIHYLAFADRYNELRELCKAGFCNEEMVKEQERAWIERSDNLVKIYEGTGYETLIKELMIDQQIDFINILKYVISSRIKERTYITRLDFTSNLKLKNSINKLYSELSKLSVNDVVQYNAILGAYVIPYLEFELKRAGYDYSEYNDLSLTGGAYDLVYREFLVSSNRMFYGKNYNRIPTEYVKLEGKILRISNMLMLLLRNGDEKNANFYNCNQTYCTKQDAVFLYDSFNQGVSSLEKLCKKKKCNSKQLERMKGVYIQYDKLIGKLAIKHRVPHIDHVMTQVRAMVTGRVLRDYDIYSK